MKLGIDIGCGGNIISRADTRFFRLDIQPKCRPDICGNATELPFANAIFDIVHSSHCLEHFPRNIWRFVLAEWIRVLKPVAEIWFNLPNILWAAERMVNDKIIDGNVLNVLYGGQDNEYDFHYNGLTPEIMEKELSLHGFRLIHFTTQMYNMFLGAERG